jgi:hypothetical protein
MVLQTAHNFHLEDLQEDVLQFIFAHGIFITSHLLFIITSHVLTIISSHVLLFIAEKYMLDVIKIECKRFLTANINDDDACMVLQSAHNFALADLQNDALQFIFLHGKSCLESTSFLGLSSGCVKLIIESEKLICTEEFVYQKMIQWAEQQCNKEPLFTYARHLHTSCLELENRTIDGNVSIGLS